MSNTTQRHTPSGKLAVICCECHRQFTCIYHDETALAFAEACDTCPECFIHPSLKTERDSLLAALQALSNYIDSDSDAYAGDDDGTLGRVMYAAHAAIQKAEGQEASCE